MSTDPGDVGRLASLASLLECSVDKPGNVGPGKDFQDTTYSDFVLSSLILGSHCEDVAKGKNFGEGILDYVKECKKKIGTNTHLGTAILFMPLARSSGTEGYMPDIASLRTVLKGTLLSAGIDESIHVCKAIKTMEPAGLQDPCFSDSPVDEIIEGIEKEKKTYIEWMSLGAHLDGVALETITFYKRTFHWAEWLCLRGHIRRNVLELYIRILAESPDTLVAGTKGMDMAEMICNMAGVALESMSANHDNFLSAVERLSRFCVDSDANPGTTADITGAAIYSALLCGVKP